ncbi:hypothetical protein AB0M02_34320 [Actinoplanes sp. NPDC051861]|uniref:hypothetical protein n=1 Tax=Actinoplanes sp. NPDC051861 TaxID=3155170 RepID=UPI00343A942E
MSVTGLIRTQYWNVSGPNPTPRSGNTSHAESRTDFEGYLLAADAAGNQALLGSGVAIGLRVSAVAGAAGITIGLGTAYDADGRVIVLGDDGVAVVDPQIGAGGVQNIPTVPVTADGLVFDTAGVSGELFFTVTWREVEEVENGLLVLRQAPWLRLVDPATYVDDGLQLVLALVTLDATGLVEDLVPGPRRLVSVTAGRFELRLPSGAAGTPFAADQRPAAQVGLAAGGLGIDMLPAGGAPARVLGADPAGNHLTLMPSGGDVGIGLRGGPARRTLHVEGGEIHSGGGGGGFSFADRSTGGGFVEIPGGGQRWVWYANNGAARLWSGADWLAVRPKDGGLRMETAAHLEVGNPLAVASTVGIRQNRLYLSGDAGWSSLSYNAVHNAVNGDWVFPDPSRPAVTLEMDDSGGVPRFAVFTTTPANTSAWQFRMGVDGNTGKLSVPGGASFDGIVSVNTSTPNPRLVGSLQVTSASGTGICAIAQDGTAVTALANKADRIGLVAIGTPTAAQFNGDVSVSGTLFAGAKQFLIDHPLDPDNRVLAHASVESSERVVVYSGTVTCDAEGNATVALPDWLEALATDFRYQLTCVGSHAPVYVSRPVEENSFAIAGGTADLTVSWQLTGVRHDPWAQQNDLLVEQDKQERERGFYEHPEAYGRDLTASVHWARNDEVLRAHPILARQVVRQRAEHEEERMRVQDIRRASS